MLGEESTVELPGHPLAPGQGEPEVLCVNGLRHVAPYYVIVHLSLGHKHNRIGITVEQCLENLIKKESLRMKPPARWWMLQLQRGRLFADKSLTEPPVSGESRIQNGDCLWGTFHYHEQAIHYDCGNDTAIALHDGENYVVVNKPAGVDVLSNPGAGRVRNSLPGLVAFTSNHLLLPAHRLDNPVSGLVCCGRTVSDVKRLSRRIQFGETQKRYIARVSIPDKNWDILEKIPLKIDQPVAFDADKCVAYIDRNRGKGAVTIIEKCMHKNFADDTAVIVIRIQTGRKHQIRVHLRRCGMPIANDERYGGKSRHFPITKSAFGIPNPPPALQTLYRNHFDEDCEDCAFVNDLWSGKRGLGPSVNQGIWLHCWRYEFPTLSLQFEAPLPLWAAPLK